jgi:hypothetical protein
MIHGLVGEAREELFEKLIVVRMGVDREVDMKQVPPIHWDRMVDQPSETRVGGRFWTTSGTSLQYASSGGYTSGCIRRSSSESSLWTVQGG